MKRFLKILGLVVLLLIVAVVGIVAATFMGRQSITDGLEVNNVRIVKDGITSVGVFPVGDRQVGLIDAGTDAEGAAILAELTRRQLGPDAVVAIFITHGHQDHTAAIRKFPNAQVMALDLEVGRVEGTDGFSWSRDAVHAGAADRGEGRPRPARWRNRSRRSDAGPRLCDAGSHTRQRVVSGQRCPLSWRCGRHGRQRKTGRITVDFQRQPG